MNQYDDVQLPITELLTQQKNNYQSEAHSGQQLDLLRMIESFLARYLTAASYRAGLHRRLIYSHLKLSWFYEFRQYWVKELGLRRIEPHDFYYLSSLYRQKFQNLSVNELQGSQAFLKAWQDPSALYLIFAYQYKLALHPLSAYTIAKYIPPNAKVCEYGCGLGPITTSLATYYPTKNLNITAIDIPSYLLHFLRWKHRHNNFINVAALDPADTTPLKDNYDVITCMTVFEHLPNPLPIIKHFHQQLNPGGILMFDYIKSEGEGLDTVTALKDRQQVLDFIQKNFTIIKGDISKKNQNIKATICRKK